MCLCVRMLALEWKGKAFVEKVNSRCFCWFPAAILVDSFCPPIWRLHTKLYKGAWNVSANNSETVGHKDLRFGRTVQILVLDNIHFLGFFHWTVSIYFLTPCLLRDSENEEPFRIRIFLFLSYSIGIETINTFQTIPDSRPKWAKCIPVF